jgi:GntR family transcriptional regulator
VRDLASHLLVNPNTIARVYRDLEREGLLETRRGQGTFISPNAAALADSERRRLVSEKLADAASDVRTFGLSDQEALTLFRQILSDHPPREEKR